MQSDEFMRCHAILLQQPTIGVCKSAICLHVIPCGLTVIEDLLKGLAAFTSFWRHVVYISAKHVYSKALWLAVWAAKGKGLQEMSFLSVLDAAVQAVQHCRL